MLTIYSARTGRIRRKIFDAAASDQELLNRFPPGTGEAVHVSAVEVSQIELNGITGLQPVADRYVAVQRTTGVVHQVFIADPAAGDAVANHDLVRSRRAVRGWRMSRSGDFERSLQVINSDLTRVNARIARLNSPGYVAHEVASGLTLREAQDKRDENLGKAGTRRTLLQEEKTARQGPRP